MNEVDILGTTYTIREETLKDEEIDGFCDYFNHVICIRGDNYNNVGNFKKLQNQSLRHEIIHAFLAESGLQANFEHSQSFGHEETMIDWIAIQFPKIAKVYEKLGILEI